MESDTDDVEIELSGEGKKITRVVERGAKLETQTAKTGRVVGKDAEVQFGVGEEFLDLVELVGVVKSHLAHALLGSVAHVRLGLAGLGVDDARGVDTEAEDHINLSLGGAIKTGAHCSQQAQDLRVGVAFDGVVGLDAVEVLLPAQVLAVDVAHVGDEESVLFAGLASIFVDALHTLLQSTADHGLG